MKTAIFSIFSTLTFFILLASFVNAYPSLKITANSDVTQQAGTTAEYAATVTNTGDMLLEEVYLTFNFLPSRWHNATERIHLPAGNSSVLHYTLTLPSDAEGNIKYNLTANGIMGIGIVAQDKAEVTLKITSAAGSSAAVSPAAENGQSTTTSSTAEVTTTAALTTTAQTIETAQSGTQEDVFSRYKLMLISILVGVGAIFAMAAFVFWKD